MTMPQPPIEAELFARGLDVILTDVERQVIREVQVTIDRLMEQILEAEAAFRRTPRQPHTFEPSAGEPAWRRHVHAADPLRNHAATAGQ